MLDEGDTVHIKVSLLFMIHHRDHNKSFKLICVKFCPNMVALDFSLPQFSGSFEH